MSTFVSTRLHQSSSSYTLDQLDPTTLAISLIPLLAPQLSQEQSGNQSVTLPVLAASLSTLPHSVVNAIHFLAQELKNLKEQHVLAGRSHRNANPTNADNENDERDRENREKWLDNQKVNHLKKSISSLTNLQSTLQSRLLTTVDTLSDLQQTHKRDTQQLADERDGVRAVNQVLKRKIATLEKQLQESKEIMESVLERVQVVNKGDWSIIEHGVIQVFSPLPQPSNLPEQANAQDNSLRCEELCTFHQQCQGDSSPVLRPESFDPPPKIPNFLSSSSSSRTDGYHLNRSTTSDSNNRNNQRSLTLIVELTEELENLRQEVKVELKSKHDEINRLKSLIGFRDDEINQLMTRLEHFMGLDGFYVRDSPDDQPTTTEYAPESLSSSMVDLEATPRQKLDQRTKAAPNNTNSTLVYRPDMRENSPDSQSSDQRKLEEEIKQLEIQLKEVTQARHLPLSSNSATNPNTFAFDLPTGKPMPENDRSSLISVNPSDDQAISRVLADLSNQVAELKFTLKEVSRERDALKRLRSRNKKPPSSASSQTDLCDSSTSPETSRALQKALDRSKFECTRLNRLLAQSESRILELQRQIAEQESEFERVAERVQEKLKDQRSKMLQAQTHIDQLQHEVEQVRSMEQTTRQELLNERKRVESLMGLLDRKKRSTHDERIQIKKDHANVNHKQHSRSSVVSSSSPSAASSKPFPPSSKDPFN